MNKINEKVNLLFEINRMVLPEDIDEFINFFNNLLNSEKEKKLCINYKLHSNSFSTVEIFTRSQIANEILNKGFFPFREYLIRASRKGYLNEDYPIEKNKIIIRNISVDINCAKSNHNYLLLKLFANHLLPNNEILQIEQSQIFLHTYIFTYKNELNKKKLLEDYYANQLPALQEDFIDCFHLNSCLIKQKRLCDLDDGLNLKLNNFIVENATNCKYFIDTRRYFDLGIIIIQFKKECQINKENDKFIELIEKFCKSNELIFERCNNFELLKLANFRIFKDVGIETSRRYYETPIFWKSN